MALTQEQVTLITVAAFGTAPGADHLAYFQNSATGGGFKVNGGNTNISTLLPYDTELEAVAAVLEHERSFLEGKNNLQAQTDAEFVASVVANLGAADGASLAAALANGTPRYKALVEFALAEEAKGPIANVTNAAGSLDDVEQDLIANGTPIEPTDPSVPGESLSLTTGADRGDAFVGTSGNDVFVANVEQNAFGHMVNTLGTSDKMDGFAGENTLRAELINGTTSFGGSTIAPRPQTDGIQNVEITALAVTDFLGDNLQTVTLDAMNMNGVKSIGSYKSDAHLNIINLRADQKAGVTGVTELDMNIVMKDTSNAGANTANLDVRFDQNSLVPGQSISGEDQVINFELMNVAGVQEARENNTGEAVNDIALKGVNLFRMEFNLGGQLFNMVDYLNEDMEEGEDISSYDDLLEAANTALVAMKADNPDNAALENLFFRLQGTFEVAGTNLTGQNLQLVAPFDADLYDEQGPLDEYELTIDRSNVNNAAVLMPADKPNVEAGVRNDNITIGQPATAGAAEDRLQANIELDNVGRGSEGGNLTIGSMSPSKSSTGVEIFNVEVKRTSDIGNFYGTNGRFEELRISNGVGEGDLIFRNDQAVGDANGTAQDKADFDAYANTINGGKLIHVSNFAGDINLGSENAIRNVDAITVTGNTHVTLDAQYTGTNSGVITTGGGNDTIDVQLAGGPSTTINTGNGTDTVTLTGTGTATVNGGTSVDTIHGNGISLTANTGGGADVIYAENTGNKAVFTIAQLPNATGLDGTQSGTAQLLMGREVTVTLAVDGTANSNTLGFESQPVTITASSGVLTTQHDLNVAIRDAINGDSVLNKLAEASIVNDQVVVTYKVDGAQQADAVKVEISERHDSFAQVPNQSQLLSAWKDYHNDSDITAGNLQTAYNWDNTTTQDLTSAYQDTASPVTATVTETTEGAEAQEAVYTFDLAGVNVPETDGVFTIDGITVASNTTGTAWDAAALAAVIDGDTVTLSGDDYVVDATDENAVTLTAVNAFVLAAAGTITLAVTGTASPAAPTDANATVTTAGVAEAFEVQTIDLGTQTVAADGTLTFTIDGQPVTYTNDTGSELTTTDLVDEIAGLVATINGATYTFTDNAGTLTLTQSDVGSNIIDVSVASGTDSSGSNSGTNGVNTINAGAGDDIIVLSSNDGTSDTVEFTGYNQGTNTIVHFNDAAGDRLDFTSYLTGTAGKDPAGTDTSSSSPESEVPLTITEGTNLAFQANSINVINFTQLSQMPDTVAFGEMTTAQLEAALNHASSGASVAELAGLYQTNGKSVLLIEDAQNQAGAIDGVTPNAGVYKAFEITYANDVVTTTEEGDFSAQLIGTLDFGEAQALAGSFVMA